MSICFVVVVADGEKHGHITDEGGRMGNLIIYFYLTARVAGVR